MQACIRAVRNHVVSSTCIALCCVLAVPKTHTVSGQFLAATDGAIERLPRPLLATPSPSPEGDDGADQAVSLDELIKSLEERVEELEDLQ